MRSQLYGSQNFPHSVQKSTESKPIITTTVAKPTAGLYKRLKKEIVDLEEGARKKLTGGKADIKKLEDTMRIS